jgi:hypothetical protein
MKFCLAYLFMLMAGLGWSQNNFLPTHHFFKDQLFSNQLQAPVMLNAAQRHNLQ